MPELDTEAKNNSTDDTLKRTVVKNATANLLRLGGSGLVALCLPPFLVRMLPKDVYGAWAILLQITLYLAYFDFGIQTAVARFVAHYDELKHNQQRDATISTAFILLCVAALVGFAAVTAVSLRLPAIFHQMPPGLFGSAKVALLFMGGSFALGLPISVISAFFIGIQRNELPALIAVLNKLAMALLTIGVVLKHWGLAAMGAAVGIANVGSYALAIALWRFWRGSAHLRLTLASKSCAQQIASYSSALVVWMVATLMISGLDLVIVGIFDYHSTAYYAIAASITNFVAQTQGAIFAALLPASAVLGARGDGLRLGRLLVSSTRYGMLILLAMACPLIVAGHFVIRLWAGADFAQHSTVILQVLMIANVIRLCALPYSTLLLGTGQQKQVIASPLAEGITNLVTSVAGAYFFGAIGVALGTLVGSLVSIGMHLFYNVPRTAVILINRSQLIRESLIRPAFCVAPFVLLLALRYLFHGFMLEAQVSLTAAATVGSALLIWNYGLIAPERQKLAHALRQL
jgi:O-antigen/teichoic acid export membrane protein